MEAIAGMRATRRRLQGPGLDVVGLDGAEGNHIALCYGADAAGLRDAVPAHARAFLERPGLPGLARLVSVDADAGACVFATGKVWPVAELLVHWRLHGDDAGVRRGLELAWTLGAVLARAQAEGAMLGAPAHGGLDPWHVGVRPDGQVVCWGYGLTRPRAATLSDAAQDERLRYLAPEVAKGKPATASSDGFALALIALEVMLGEPVYGGSGDALRHAVVEASVDRRLYGLRDRLPADVVDVFGRATRADADARFATTTAFVEAVQQVLASPVVHGSGLRATVAALPPPEARFVGLDELRTAADEAEPDVVVDAPEPPKARWVSLGGRRAGRKRERATTAPAMMPEASTLHPDRAHDPTEVVPRPVLAPETERVSLDSLREEVTDQERRLLRIRLPSQEAIVHAASPDASCAEVARQVADRVGLVTVDLQGRIRVAWALSQHGTRCAGSMPVRALDGDAVTLERLANRPCDVTIEVRSGGDAKQFEARVGVAVTARQLVAHVRDKLDLGPGTGAVRVDGTAIGPDDLLVGSVRDGVRIEVVT